MDRRVAFFLVFIITVTSMVLVALVSWFSGNSPLNTILYTLVTMWIMGVLSQLLIHNMYVSIVKPMDDKKYEDELKRKGKEIHSEEAHDIDQFLESQRSQATGENGREVDHQKEDRLEEQAALRE